MAFLSSLDISGSALTAQRLRMDVVAQNVANMDTTRNADGEVYTRRYVIFQERGTTPSFSDYYNNALSGSLGSGVRVSSIEEDTYQPYTMTYDPSHPDADENGYVLMPNVDLVTELADMMSATRSYEANITVLNATKSMAMNALDIGK